MFEKIISTIKKGVKKENVLFSLLIALICVGWSSVSASVLEQALNYHYNSQSNQLNNDKAQLASCQWDLNTANTNYKTALAMNQEPLYTQAINQAKKARTCIGEYSVSTSSLTTLNHKIARYRTAIQKRTQYLQQNQNIIIKNYDMLNINKLRELQSITSALESTKK